MKTLGVSSQRLGERWTVAIRETSRVEQVGGEEGEERGNAFSVSTQLGDQET